MFIFEDKFLPLSNYRYRLNKFGEIIDLNDGLVKTEIIDGKKVVKIDWYAGNKYYEIGNIIAIIRFDIKIPFYFWDLIKPIYNDGNYTNTNISNISYCFKNGPIEVIDKPGFYYIPYYTTYAISKDCVTINLKNNHILSWYITKPNKIKNRTGGYCVNNLFRDDKGRVQTSRHRLMSLAFLPYSSNPLKLIINHKNGIPGNDSPSNLEWVTYKQNNQHAYDNGLFPNKVRPVIAKNLITGEEHTFISLAKCAQTLNIDETIIRHRIGKNKHIQYKDSWVFKEDDGSIWPKLNNEFIKTNKNAYAIVARNIFTDEYIIYDTIEDASNKLNICLQSVRDNVRKEKIIPINGFNFRYLTNNISWPNHSEKHLLIYKHFPKRPSDGVLVTDLNGNELEFFESYKLAAEAYNYHVSSIVRLCKQEQTISGKLFYRYRLTENLCPPIK